MPTHQQPARHEAPAAVRRAPTPTTTATCAPPASTPGSGSSRTTAPTPSRSAASPASPASRTRRRSTTSATARSCSTRSPTAGSTSSSSASTPCIRPGCHPDRSRCGRTAVAYVDHAVAHPGLFTLMFRPTGGDPGRGLVPPPHRPLRGRPGRRRAAGRRPVPARARSSGARVHGLAALYATWEPRQRSRDRPADRRRRRATDAVARRPPRRPPASPSTSPEGDLPMSHPQHVVLGAGTIGTTIAEQLAAAGETRSPRQPLRAQPRDRGRRDRGRRPHRCRRPSAPPRPARRSPTSPASRRTPTGRRASRRWPRASWAVSPGPGPGSRSSTTRTCTARPAAGR